jgi:anti-anti-sigma factor
MDIKTEVKNRKRVFYPAGNLDLTASLHFEKYLNEILNLDEECDFIINMKDIMSMSSSCMSILIKVEKKLRKRNCKLRLSNISQVVRELISISNLDTVISTYENEEEALYASD